MADKKADKISDRYLAEIGGATGEKMGLVEHLPEMQNCTLLEIGPGTGNALLLLLDQIKIALEPAHYPQVKVFDIFPDVLRRLEDSIGQTEIEIEYVCGDGSKRLPFPDASIKGINVSSVVHECFSYGGGYTGIHNLASECGRILSLGGIVTYRDPEGLKLNNRVRANLKSPVAKLFLAFFLPKFLGRKHSGVARKIDLGYENDLTIYLNGRRLSLQGFVEQDQCTIEEGNLVIDCASGLIHEIQRHFVLFSKTLRLGEIDVEDALTALREQHKISLEDIEGSNDPNERQRIIDLFTGVGAVVDGEEITFTANQINILYQRINIRNTEESLNANLLYILDWSRSEGEEHYFYGACEETVARFALFSFGRDDSSPLGYSCLCPMSLDRITKIERGGYTELVGEHIDRDDGNGYDRKFNVHFQKLPIEDAMKILVEYYTRTNHPALAEALRYFIESVRYYLEEQIAVSGSISSERIAQAVSSIDGLINVQESPHEAISTISLGEDPECIGLIGGIATGKTTLATILGQKGYSVITLSDFIREEIAREGLDIHRRETFFEMGNSMRERFGNDVLANLCIEKIRREGLDRFVIDGIRVVDEIEALRAAFGEIVMIAIETSTEARIRRLRDHVKGLVDEVTRAEILTTMYRESYDPSPHGCRLDEAISLADICLTPDGETVADLEMAMEKVITITTGKEISNT